MSKMRSKRKASKLDTYTPSYMQKPKSKRARVTRASKARHTEDQSHEKKEVPSWRQLGALSLRYGSSSSSSSSRPSRRNKMSRALDRDGSGTSRCVYPGGASYRGDWRHHLRHGRGVLKRSDGTTEYEGDWELDLPQGKGVFHWSTGARYEGEFKEGYRCGSGVKYRARVGKDGEKLVEYDGQWEKDQPHGRGAFRYLDGSRYDGLVERGMRHGLGVLNKKNGEQYDGDWSKDKKNGQGMCRYSDGMWYTGGWKNDKPHGFGKDFYSDGRHYEGDFRHEKKHGQGKFFRRDGTVEYSGLWYNNQKHGFGVVHNTDGTEFRGLWSHGVRHGRGETYRKATATDNEELIAIEIYDQGKVAWSSRNPATSEQLMERREIAGNETDLLMPLENEVGQYASQTSQDDEVYDERGADNAVELDTVCEAGVDLDAPSTIALSEDSNSPTIPRATNISEQQRKISDLKEKLDDARELVARLEDEMRREMDALKRMRGSLSQSMDMDKSTDIQEEDLEEPAPVSDCAAKQASVHVNGSSAEPVGILRIADFGRVSAGSAAGAKKSVRFDGVPQQEVNEEAAAGLGPETEVTQKLDMVPKGAESETNSHGLNEHRSTDAVLKPVKANRADVHAKDAESLASGSLKRSRDSIDNRSRSSCAQTPSFVSSGAAKSSATSLKSSSPRDASSNSGQGATHSADQKSRKRRKCDLECDLGDKSSTGRRPKVDSSSNPSSSSSRAGARGRSPECEPFTCETEPFSVTAHAREGRDRERTTSSRATNASNATTSRSDDSRATTSNANDSSATTSKFNTSRATDVTSNAPKSTASSFGAATEKKINPHLSLSGFTRPKVVTNDTSHHKSARGDNMQLPPGISLPKKSDGTVGAAGDSPTRGRLARLRSLSLSPTFSASPSDAMTHRRLSTSRSRSRSPPPLKTIPKGSVEFTEPQSRPSAARVVSAGSLPDSDIQLSERKSLDVSQHVHFPSQNLARVKFF